jgi:hypothetical protein
VPIWEEIHGCPIGKVVDTLGSIDGTTGYSLDGVVGIPDGLRWFCCGISRFPEIRGHLRRYLTVDDGTELILVEVSTIWCCWH